ncbi:uncharacterized protein ACRADG_003923 [Cochliomyia hominivorax]
MNNNPFRRKPSSNIKKKVENWGKTKFKPTKFASDEGKITFNINQGVRTGGNKSFNGKFDKRKGKNFHKNNEKYKFNQVARDAKPENATPWNKYKDEIVFKQREEEQAALQANMESSEAKNMLKQREINYRKLLIEEKKQEPTKWEDFEEEETNKKENNIIDNSKSADKKNRKQKSSEQKLNKQPKRIFKKNVLNSETKTDVKEFISKKLLENFDSKKLNYKQNNKLRRAITKATYLAKGGVSIDKVVKDLKRKKIQQQFKEQQK